MGIRPDKNSVKRTNREKKMEKFQPKERFVERMQELLGEDGAKEFFDISYYSTPDSIRCNTLKISVEDLKKRLEARGWELSQPFGDFPEIMIVESNLKPGELGKAEEHLLGYFYVQDISSMLPLMVLRPQPGEIFLDLCASPGSKTTQAAAMMENTGTIIANEKNLGRISILNSNLEKCGVTNTIVTKNDGIRFCNRLFEKGQIKFDKILVDAPCTGEGTLRKSPKTFLMWNENVIKKTAKIQGRLAAAALRVLKVGGEMIYSTCTLGPEENEEIVNYLLDNFEVEVLPITLPLKCRQGICEWEGRNYSKEIKKACRIYPQDNNTDGFFLARIKKLSDKGLGIRA